tara:strand:- start:2099 stop:2500 length:402 start_codon:yes stop_codon:yes gene_type:complete
MRILDSKLKYKFSLKLFSGYIVVCLLSLQFLGLFHSIIHNDFKKKSEYHYKHNEHFLEIIFNHDIDSKTCLILEKVLIIFSLKSSFSKVIENFLNFRENFLYVKNFKNFKNLNYYFSRAPPSKFPLKNYYFET